jgi:hypothetical protein
MVELNCTREVLEKHQGIELHCDGRIFFVLAFSDKFLNHKFIELGGY